MMPDAHPYAPLSEVLGSIGRCVLFDKRGTGLSDRDLGFGSLEERADDIRAVMDDVGFETASIFGYSEGALTHLRSRLRQTGPAAAFLQEVGRAPARA